MSKSHKDNNQHPLDEPDYDFLLGHDVEIYRTIVDRMKQGVLVYDNHQVLASNSQLCKVIDCPPEIVVPGTSLEEYIRFGAKRGDYSSSIGLTLQSMRMHIAAGKDYIVERCLPDGRTIRIDCRNQGNFGVGTYTDITQQKKQSDILETTIDTMAQGLLVLDEYNIIAANDELVKLLNIPSELVQVGKSWNEVLLYRSNRGDFEKNDGYIENAKKAFDENQKLTSETQAGSKTLLTEYRHQHSMTFITFTDITEAREREIQLLEKEAEVRKIANIDAITGLSNRRAFDNELSRRLTEHCNNKKTTNLALILIDLDSFKAINDTHGHGVGDALLQELSKRFKSVVRHVDTIARIGGDEFAAIIETPDQVNIQKFVNKLHKVIRAVVVIDRIELRIDASIGVAIQSKEMIEPKDILTAADLALYDAKKQGRGIIRVYETELSERAKKRYAIEQDLQTALENDELILHYQVQRDLKTNKNIGYEAVMRWQHPIRGMVFPDDFISIAEETGNIVEMGRWALQKATFDISKLDDTSRIAVNVSPVQFVKSDLVSDIKEALVKSGLSAHRLEIEITEQLLIKDTDNVLRILNELCDMGVSVSLDDFGSGYSSLAYLTNFPFSKLKIDRYFIDKMMQDEKSKSLVKSILVLASSLNMKVTAEGVETHDQVRMLVENNCDEAQGYFFGQADTVAQLKYSSDKIAS